MSARRKRVISTEEIQFNHKPAKMLLTEKKKGVSQNGQTPSIIGICSYCVINRPVFERCQTLLHPELTPWWSFPLADGAHHKKPHSPTHPPVETKCNLNHIHIEWGRTEVRWGHASINLPAKSFISYPVSQKLCPQLFLFVAMLHILPINCISYYNMVGVAVAMVISTMHEKSCIDSHNA